MKYEVSWSWNGVHYCGIYTNDMQEAWNKFDEMQQDPDAMDVTISGTSKPIACV